MSMRELNTFSIVARCGRRGELGVAVSSAVPAVGSMCPYLAAGVGAVSTQSWVNPYLAIDVLAAMGEGAKAQEALERALEKDSDAALRQIGVVGPQGPGAAWSGPRCTPWKGQLIGDDFAIQGNMLVGEATLLAMREAWLRAPEVGLAERLLCALEAGDRAGGDMRGKQSAALRVVGAEAYCGVDLRVDEHSEPLVELRRIFAIAEVQLFPFVQSMPLRSGVSGSLSDEVTQMLLRPPAER